MFRSKTNRKPHSLDMHQYLNGDGVCTQGVPADRLFNLAAAAPPNFFVPRGNPWENTSAIRHSKSRRTLIGCFVFPWTLRRRELLYNLVSVHGLLFLGRWRSVDMTEGLPQLFINSSSAMGNSGRRTTFLHYDFFLTKNRTFPIMEREIGPLIHKHILWCLLCTYLLVSNLASKIILKQIITRIDNIKNICSKNLWFKLSSNKDGEKSILCFLIAFQLINIWYFSAFILNNLFHIMLSRRSYSVNMRYYTQFFQLINAVT